MPNDVTAPLPTVHSLCWSNIAPEIREGQARVCAHLGIPLQQHERDRLDHGTWMDQVLTQAPENALVVFCDIDAIPLRRDAVVRMVARAGEGALCGLAQSANHLGDPGHVYAGPMFMALRRRLWDEVGRPSLTADASNDPAQRLTRAAEAAGIPVETMLPTGCLKPMWNLAGRRVFGIGTFYGDNDFFHLFQARKKRNIRVFARVCDDVVAGRPLDFGSYLVTLNGKRRMPKPLRRFFD